MAVRPRSECVAREAPDGGGRKVHPNTAEALCSKSERSRGDGTVWTVGVLHELASWFERPQHGAHQGHLVFGFEIPNRETREQRIDFADALLAQNCCGVNRVAAADANARETGAEIVDQFGIALNDEDASWIDSAVEKRSRNSSCAGADFEDGGSVRADARCHQARQTRRTGRYRADRTRIAEQGSEEYKGTTSLQFPYSWLPVAAVKR
jgi:hypothetical protein